MNCRKLSVHFPNKHYETPGDARRETERMWRKSCLNANLGKREDRVLWMATKMLTHPSIRNNASVGSKGTSLAVSIYAGYGNINAIPGAMDALTKQCTDDILYALPGTLDSSYVVINPFAFAVLLFYAFEQKRERSDGQTWLKPFAWARDKVPYQQRKRNLSAIKADAAATPTHNGNENESKKDEQGKKTKWVKER